MTVYQKNIEALAAKYPAYAAGLEALAIPAEYQIVTARSGQPTLKVSREGRDYYAHSAYDPAQESAKYVQTYVAEHEQLCREAAFAIVIGVGGGYHVFELLQQVTWLKELILIEPDPVLLKLALHCRDLRELIAHPHISWVIGGVDLDTFRNLHGAQWLNLGGRIVLPSLYMTQYGKDYVDKVNDLIREFVEEKDFTAQAYIKSGRPMLENQFKNIPHMFTYPSVNELFGQYTGVPCVCIAAGPSLNDYLDDLKVIRDKAIFICADTAFKVLIENGIKPDIVTAVDPLPYKFKYFEDNPHLTDGVLLVAGTAVYPGIINSWQGPVRLVLAGNKEFSFYFEDVAYPGVEHLPNFYTVALSSLIIGDRLGCEPIVLVGQDLCYRERDHAAGASLVSRVDVIEKNGEKYIQSTFQGAPYVYAGVLAVKPGFSWDEKAYFAQDYVGNLVVTSNTFLGYIHKFENYFTRLPAGKVMNLTRTGACLKGATRIDGDSIRGLLARTNRPDALPMSILQEVRMSKLGVEEQIQLVELKIHHLSKELMVVIDTIRTTSATMEEKYTRIQALFKSWNHHENPFMKFVDSQDPKGLIRQCKSDLFNFDHIESACREKKKYHVTLKKVAMLKRRIATLSHNIQHARLSFGKENR